MPKVEAKDHRHRIRPTPLSRPRFPTLQAEDHTYEFDRQYLSLRISGSGYQDFLSSGDARALYGFLRRIYEPAERTTIPLRRERRARRHSQRHAQRTEHQATPRPDQDVNEVHKEASLDFGEEYYGSPSWRVYTIMTSFDETREHLEGLAMHQPGGRGAVRRAVLGSVEHWKKDIPTPHAEAAQILVTDFLMGGVRRVEWTPVYDMLRGEKAELGEANELTTLAYQLLAQTDWQAVVKDAKYLTDADTLLQDWLENQCLTWIDSPDARAHTGSAGQFANTVLDISFQAVDWEKVTKALRGE